MLVDTFTVDGVEAIHLAPDKLEGYLYTAEEMYDMLMDKYSVLIREFYAVLTKGVDYDRFKMISDIHRESEVQAA